MEIAVREERIRRSEQPRERSSLNMYARSCLKARLTGTASGIRGEPLQEVVPPFVFAALLLHADHAFVVEICLILGGFRYCIIGCGMLQFLRLLADIGNRLVEVVEARSLAGNSDRVFQCLVQVFHLFRRIPLESASSWR